MLPSLVPKHLQENSQARRAPRTPQFNHEPGILFYLSPRQSPAGTENPAKLKVALSPNSRNLAPVISPPSLPATNGGGMFWGRQPLLRAEEGRLSIPIPNPVALLVKLGAGWDLCSAPGRRSSSGAKPSGDSAVRLGAFFPRSFRARQIPRRRPDRLCRPGAQTVWPRGAAEPPRWSARGPGGGGAPSSCPDSGVAAKARSYLGRRQRPRSLRRRPTARRAAAPRPRRSRGPRWSA